MLAKCTVTIVLVVLGARVLDVYVSIPGCECYDRIVLVILGPHVNEFRLCVPVSLKIVCAFTTWVVVSVSYRCI